MSRISQEGCFGYFFVFFFFNSNVDNQFAFVTPGTQLSRTFQTSYVYN